MLAFRRQAHQEHDAAERRVTELYNAAAEQLDSDKAPVRLTALYTLERLANDNPRHRQTMHSAVFRAAAAKLCCRGSAAVRRDRRGTVRHAAGQGPSWRAGIQLPRGGARPGLGF